MTQGELEAIPQEVVRQITELEERIMEDIVRKIEENGFSGASADWQINRLQQLGMTEEEIRQQIAEALEATDEEIDAIFSDEAYLEWYGHERVYRMSGVRRLPFEENRELQELIAAMKYQTKGTFRNMTASMGFAIRDPETGKIINKPLADFYRDTLDAAMWDISTGAFDYNTVLKRTIMTMTASGIRTVDFASGTSRRVDVAARTAVMTGFRQIQGKINEQVAAQLGTDYFEVSYHVGARPSHQPWQGRVYSKAELESVCGLGTVTGLHGANCYHDYNAFIPGISTRTYTDEQLDQMIAEENEPKEYLGKQYTTYEALQQQRKQERAMRKTRQDIALMQAGGGEPEDITLMKAKYQGQLQAYGAFSEKMKLPSQMDRVYQDGLNWGRNPSSLGYSGNSRDREQFERYKKIFGSEIPDKLDGFLKLKYNEPKKWAVLKHNYRVLNSYEANNGSMSNAKILELDQKAFDIKKKQFTGKAKKHQANIAVMEFDGEVKIANSQVNKVADIGYVNFKGDKKQIVLKIEEPQFATMIIGTHKRDIDSEAKLFEFAAMISKDGQEHTINLLSEKCMCDSCLDVMKQFKAAYPKVTVSAVSNKRERSEKNKNKPWKYRSS